MKLFSHFVIPFKAISWLANVNGDVQYAGGGQFQSDGSVIYMY